MWLLTSEDDKDILFDELADIVAYATSVGVLDFSVRYVPKFTKETGQEKEEGVERRIYNELIPLSRAKES